MFKNSKFPITSATDFVAVYRKIAVSTVKMIDNTALKGVVAAATEYNFASAERFAHQFDTTVESMNTKMASYSA